MSKSPKTKLGMQSLYTAVTTTLSRPHVHQCEAIFATSEIVDDTGRRYRVGPVIREAWKAETKLPPAVVREIVDLIRAALDANVSTYTPPTCCQYHSKVLLSSFAHSGVYPPVTESLAVISQLMWALLPKLRGIVKMNPTPTSRSVPTSRFMVFENFLKWHVRDVIAGGQPLVDAKVEYSRLFSPTRNEALRRAELRRRLVARKICGMVGARAEVNTMKPAEPHHCDQRRPFSTPVQLAATTRLDHPDGELKKLGLQFDKNQRYVELIYRVNIAPDRTADAMGPAIPSVLDAEGYWLFWPDRMTAPKNGLIWNHARDITTNKRGMRELIAGPLAVESLSDLIVWPRQTSGNWATGAADPLAFDILI